MRILVVGASGLVGSHVLAESKSRGHEVLGTYRSFAVPNLIKLDLANEAETRSLLESFRPDWVVHAAGWTWVDGCERDPARAMRENSDQPVMLAKLCGMMNMRYVYFSTTYVFDGNAGPYREDDEPNPVNVYGHSKLHAERCMLSLLKDRVIIPRIICAWGYELQKKNFVYQVLRSLWESKIMSIPSDQKGNPTWSGDIAWWTLNLMEINASGLWHLAGNLDNFTRAQWTDEIISVAIKSGIPSTGFQKQYRQMPTRELVKAARRPLNASACIGKIESRFPRLTRPPGDIIDIINRSFPPSDWNGRG